MGAPIVVQPRQNPWNNLLPQLFMMKIKHNMDMEVMDAETKRRSAQQKAQQSYTEGRTKEAGINKAKMEGYEEVPYSARMQMEKSGTAPSDVVGAFGTQLRKPAPFKPSGQIVEIDGKKVGLVQTGKNRFQIVSPENSGKPQKVWSKQAQEYVYRTPEQIAQTPDAYGMTKQTLREGQRASATQISIGEKAKLKDEAYYKGPKFIEDVGKDVKNLTGRKYKWMTPAQIEEQEKILADKRVRIRYPDAQYGEQDGKVGWYTKDADGNYKLEIPWSK